MTISRRKSRRRTRLRWTGLALVAVVLLALLVLWQMGTVRTSTRIPGETLDDVTQTLASSLPPGTPLPRFQDVTAAAGISFSSLAGERSSQLPEDMGAGAAWGDFDGDGDDDLFLVSSGGALSLNPEARAPSMLYENLGSGSFRRVEDFPDTRIIGMAAAWGDADGDGDQDLAVSGYQYLALFRNDGGHFARDQQFPAPPGFWAGLAWADFDDDRRLDLYVCHYVAYVERDAPAETSVQYGHSVPYTLNPSSYKPAANLLLHNLGDGTFVDVAAAMGVANPEGRSLAAVWNDFDQDGAVDLYVANDISDNVLYRNTGSGFEDISHPAWVADYRGAMGLAVGDWNGDGDDDLFVTHWVAQENALYDSLLADLAGGAPGNGGKAGATPLRFVDVADREGLGQIALHRIGWGAEFADVDADGRLDLVVANGSTFETDTTPRRLEPQAIFLFWNSGDSGFHDLAPLDPVLAAPHVGRGLAVSDYDGDGDLDLVVMDHGEGARLLRNDMPSGNWIQVRLQRRSATGQLVPAEGARLVARAGGLRLHRSVAPASYLSQSTRTVHFGLGAAGSVDELTVYWPGGGHQAFQDLAAGRLWTVIEGEPEAAAGATVGATAGGERERVLAFWRAQRAGMESLKLRDDCPGAIPRFRQALRLNPDHEDTVYYLAQCLSQEGQPEQALALLQQLTRRNPASHRGHRQWAVLRAATATGPEDLATARAALERALELNPEETGALLVLGEVLLLQGDLNAAELHLSWACRSNPRSALGFFLRGYVAWRQDRPDDARSLLESARPPHLEGMATGATNEGDTRQVMHREETVLSEFLDSWDGSPKNLEAVFTPLHRRLSPDLGVDAGLVGG